LRIQVIALQNFAGRDFCFQACSIDNLS